VFKNSKRECIRNDYDVSNWKKTRGGNCGNGVYIGGCVRVVAATTEKEGLRNDAGEGVILTQQRGGGEIRVVKRKET